MLHVTHQLGGARGVDAVHRNPLGILGDQLPADRAAFRHLKGHLVAGAHLDHGLDDLRNHLPRPANHHRIANAQVLARQILKVVQRRLPNSDAPQRYRL